MPYTPQTWVDNVTLVDAPHMKHIEDGIVALDAVSAPPVVNGQWLKGVGGAVVWSAITAADVAGTGVRTGTSVSTTNTDIAWTGGGAHSLFDELNPTGTASIRSYGAPLAGSGSRLVLRDGGGADVALLHATGNFFFGRGSGITLHPGETVEFIWDATVGGLWIEVNHDLQPVAYGTSLPVSPFDGQEAILVDNVANPSYQWRFRYNASSSSAYKWEFIGGAPLVADNAGVTGVSSASFIAASPSITAPRAGDYGWSLSVWLNNSALGGLSYATVATSIATAADTVSAFYQAYAANAYGHGARTGRLYGLAAAAAVSPYVHVAGGGGTGAFQNIHLELTPVRVA